MRYSFLSAMVSVSGATFASRITGFVRDVLLAQVLGASAAADIFVVAFRLPNLFRRLFGEGAFNAAFVPLLSERLAGQKTINREALQFASRILTILTLTLLVLVIVAEIFMTDIIRLIAPGFVDDPTKFSASVFYARITFPYLFFISLLSLFGACLNVSGRFIVAALAPILLNVVFIIAMGLAYINGATHTNAPFDNNILDFIIVGIAVAGVLQFMVVYWAAVRAGWRVPFSLATLWNLKRGLKEAPHERRFFRLAMPGILAGGVGQINLLIGTAIATAESGAAAWLYYADRLYQLPLALLGGALSIVLLPDLSRLIGDKGAVRQRLNNVWLIACAISLAAAAGLFVLAVPITRLLFEGGVFSTTDSLAVATAVQIFCFGLPAFILLRPLQAVFFAHQDTRAPLIDSSISVGVNITLSLSLFPHYGYIAIAIATSVAAWVNVVLALWRLYRRDIWHISGRMGLQILAQVLATSAMAGFVYGGALWFFTPTFLSDAVGPLGQWQWRVAGIGGLCVLIGAALVVFLVLVFLLRGLRRTDWKNLRQA